MRISKKPISASIAALFVAAVAVQSFGIVQAQPKGYVQADCPNIVKQAIDTVSAQCGKTARGKLCYGNSNITAQFQPGANNVQFSAPGDTVDVNALKQFTLGGMDTAANSWGVAEMKIKADLPDADPSQAVTMILFGDVQITDASADANTAAVGATQTAIAQTPTLQPPRQTQTAVVINQQATKSAATATKIAGLEATATAHALTPTPTGTIPAVKATQVAATATKLAAIENTATAAPALNTSANVSVQPYTGLQAFYFQSRDTAPCDQAPHDGILIQSPQGNKQRVTLNIDGVTISLGSTVYITAQPNKFLTISTLEGSAFVTAVGQIRAVNAGQSMQVPLDANLRASGVPKGLGFYKTDTARGLPVRVLPTNTLPFVTGLPSGVTFTTWTNVATVTSGDCGFQGVSGKTGTLVESIAYNDSAMWYSGTVLTKTSQGTYVGAGTGPETSNGIYVGSFTANYVLTVVSPTQITGTETQNDSFVGVCTYSLTLTPGALPTPTAKP